MTTKRRLFTDEFKGEAVALLERSGRHLEQVAKEFGIQPSSIPKENRLDHLGFSEIRFRIIDGCRD